MLKPLFSSLTATAILFLLLQKGEVAAQPMTTQGSSPRNIRTSSLWPDGQKQEGNRKYFVVWRGKPTTFPLHVQAGWNSISTFDPEEKGIRVRVLAFDEKGRSAGQINGLGTSDDIFLTGQTCNFTPPKPGLYKVAVQWLDPKNQVLPQQDPRRQASSGATISAQTMSLLVYQTPLPKVVVILGGWKLVPGQSDLYQRAVGVTWKNNKLTPHGYSYSLDRTDVIRRRKVKFWVAPVFPVKGLEKVSWLSLSVVEVDVFIGYQGQVVLQYFRYDPLRDAPRELDVYRVKAQVLP